METLFVNKMFYSCLCYFCTSHISMYAEDFAIINRMFSSHKTPNLSVLTVITARKRSLGQGNIFTRVCHSVHGEGSPMSLASWLPGPILLLGGLCPWSHVPSRESYPWSHVPSRGGPVAGPMFLPGGLPTMVGWLDPPNQKSRQYVRILLECFLVTARNSCGKVMFSQACVIPSVHREGSGRLPSQSDTTGYGQRASGRYACYWNAFLFSYRSCRIPHQSEMMDKVMKKSCPNV